MKHFNTVMESIGCAAARLDPPEANLLFIRIGNEMYPSSKAYQRKSHKLLKAGYNSRRIGAGESLIQ